MSFDHSWLTWARVSGSDCDVGDDIVAASVKLEKMGEMVSLKLDFEVEVFLKLTWSLRRCSTSRY